MTEHDTREAVEAYIDALNGGMRPDVRHLSAMLLRLLARAEAAEAALATARADALREAQRVCDKHARYAAQGGPHPCNSINNALWFGREQYARLCANDIGTLIPKETPHAE